MSSTPGKADENRIRRMARRQGLTLAKSKKRDLQAVGYGTYELVRDAKPGDGWTGSALVAGNRKTRYGLSLADVERVLTDQRPIRVFGPGYQGATGHPAFANDDTPAVEWDDKKDRWYLVQADGALLLYSSLPGAPEDGELVANLARVAGAEAARRKAVVDARVAESLRDTLPQRTFHTGQGHYLLGRRGIEDVLLPDGGRQSLSMSGAANLCFASELFIKSLLYKEHGTATEEWMFTHQLATLFGKLAPQHKSGINKLYVQFPGHKIQKDVKEVKNYFEDLRYYHTSKKWRYDHEAAARLADSLYWYVASVYEEQPCGERFVTSTVPVEHVLGAQRKAARSGD